ncbi:hypothetical protein [Calycomorphotria hydatis]|uniref:Addiction module component n=1 Tax=Calycomorphotria hydatis TaxID=2528027 RepID=A0A517T3I0_9PLAN|nr:hypothetical protein [Calycomorphotria hydatis]QDT62933.1 hypothetical protein V22_01310 [Calycomorphotria hydatis]
MSSTVKNELSEFHQFLSRKLNNSETDVSPEEVLAEWRERQATLESVQRGLADAEAGRVRPAEEVLAELRAKSLAG